MDLTILIVDWNAGEALGACLDRLAEAAGGVDHEILVVDNASRDGSARQVLRHPAARVIESPRNLGFAGGINLGLRHATGRYVAVLNPDVLARPRSLTLLVELLEARPGAALAGPRILDRAGFEIEQDFALPSVGGALRRLPGAARLRRLRRRADRPATPIRVERVNGCCMVFRTAALEALGGVPEETFLYGEEIAIGGALRGAGQEVWYQPQAEVIHRDGVSVEQLWSAEEKLLVFRAARVLTAGMILGRPAFALWNLVMLAGEVLYRLLTPVARAAGRAWPQVPLRETAALHLLGLAAAVRPSAARRLRRRYDQLARRGGPERGS